MIKRYNENWDSLHSKNDYDLKALPHEDWSDVFKRAKNLSILKNKEIKYIFNNIIHIVRSNTNKDILYREYILADGGSTISQDVDSKEYWKRYWLKMSKDINFEMDTISEYAMRNSISYEEAEKHFKNKPATFDTGYEIIGLPSGQVIYLKEKQLSYFKARNKIKWLKKWKNPYNNKVFNINSFTFEDANYNEIKNILDDIVW